MYQNPARTARHRRRRAAAVAVIAADPSGGPVTTTAPRTDVDVPAEADLDRAPSLLDGARSLELTPQTCNLEYWLGAVAQGTLRGLVHRGHRPEAEVPEWMREPGPLRQALIEEFAF